MNNEYTLIILFHLIFFTYNVCKLSFLGKFISLRWDTKSIYILSFIYSFLMYQIGKFAPISIALFYSIIIVLIFIETTIIFDGNKLLKYSLGFIMPLHVISGSLIVLSIYSLATKLSFMQIVGQYSIHTILRFIVYATLIVCMLLVGKIVQNKYFDHLMEEQYRLKVFVALETMMIIQVIILGGMFSYAPHNSLVMTGIIVINLLSMGVLYCGVFITIGIEIINDYKSKSVSKASDSMYKNMLMQKAIHTIEIDCLTETVVDFVSHGNRVDDYIGRYYSQISHNLLRYDIHPEDKELYKTRHSLEYMRRCIHEGRKYYDYEYRLKTEQEEVFDYPIFTEPKNLYTWHKSYVMIEHDKKSEHSRAFIVVHNIQDEKNLVISATTDALSGLYNKQTTNELISEHLNHGEVGSLFMIDIDNFKAINDNMGHDVGDSVIKEVATKLTHIFDSTDIVGRVGGDEFIVFAKTIDPEIIKARAIKVGQMMHTTYYTDTMQITISASVGICQVSPNCNSFADLYKSADNALYHSKRSGKNTYTIHSRSA
ncbi:MAG: hypothetical protein ATN35_03310 [Epulopiscium sp. Nele67-Bin004]|nr:MAG: hypothetical protein ATN35_03310 [Epulopiscium sp. Nele67-Bin004]